MARLTRMKLWVKGLLLYGAFLGVPFIGVNLIDRVPEGIVPILFCLWMCGFALAAFVFIRCPHCGESGFRTPSGWRVPWTGTKCRYCGEDY